MNSKEEILRLNKELDVLKQIAQESRNALWRLIDDDECEYDRNNFCQTHASFGTCGHELGRKLELKLYELGYEVQE